MTIRIPALGLAIRRALAITATTTLAVPALAQQAPEATTLDRIEITGSRIRQVDLETAQPVLTVSRADIERQGFNSVADILQNLTATGSPALSRASPLSAGEAAGGSYVNMRGLGAQRTLVLVNGKRLGMTTSGFQDISSIPAAAVERMEVLKDGASAIYGSDAMAGVVNIITRRNVQGVTANVYHGQYSEGDGARTSTTWLPAGPMTVLPSALLPSMSKKRASGPGTAASVPIPIPTATRMTAGPRSASGVASPASRAPAAATAGAAAIRSTVAASRAGRTASTSATTHRSPAMSATATSRCICRRRSSAIQSSSMRAWS